MGYKVTMRDRDERFKIIDKASMSYSKSEQFPFQGKKQELPSIRIPIDLPIYRMANGRTSIEQREYIRQRNLSPLYFSNGEEDQSAQAAQHVILVSMAKDDKADIYSELKRVASQSDRLLITHYGIVINGNRRLAAMRELYIEDNQRFKEFSHVDVLVLPKSANITDIESIEVELQMVPETKLNYGWIERRLKLREQINELKIPANVVQQMYRFKKREEMYIELAQLDLVDEYLDQYLKQPGAYREVKDNQLIFSLAQEAISSNPSKRTEILSIVFTLIKESDNLGERVYNFKDAFTKYVDQILDRIADDTANTEDDQFYASHGELPSQSSNSQNIHSNDGVQGQLLVIEDPLSGLLDEMSSHQTRFRAIPTQSHEQAKKIVAAFKEIKQDKKEESARNAGLKLIQDTIKMLAKVDIEASDPLLFREMLSQLKSLIVVAEQLEDKISSLIVKKEEV